jgi:molecular chaperone DnaK (HSP70)
VLQEIAGEKVISEFKENKGKNPLSYLDLVREFEAVKRTVGTEKKTKVNLTIPFVAIDEKCKDFEGKSLQSAIDSSSYVDKITLCSDRLRFNADLIIKLFTPTIDSIITLMKNTLSNRSTNGLSTILMVGGFSECPLIQDAVQVAFPGKRLIIPEDAGMSVLNMGCFIWTSSGFHSVTCDEMQLRRKDEYSF